MSKVDNKITVEVIVLMERGDTYSLNRLEHLLDQCAWDKKAEKKWEEILHEENNRLAYPINYFGVAHTNADKYIFKLEMPYDAMSWLELKLQRVGGALRYLVVNRTRR